ncbi:MAG: hypothetical protein ABMA64_39730 [Myxococcota bacterium]
MRLSTFLALAACKPSEPRDGPNDRPDPDPTVDTETVPPPATGETGTTEQTQETYDCATIPTQVGAVRQVPGAKGYHDVAFDLDGMIIGNSVFEDLLKVDFAGNVSVFVPNVGTIEQMTWLPDGDLAVASYNKGIVRVNAAGASSVINPDIYAYGLIVGPDGMLYAADSGADKVFRVDPATGASEVVVPAGSLPVGSPRVIAFTLDDDALLIGTYSGTQGRIYAVPLDANYDPSGPPVVYATGVGTGAYHDAIGVDICGYLYVPDYSTSALYRVSPSGQVQKLLDEGFIQRDYGHGLEWGNGVGGWRLDAIYLAQPYHANNVAEVVIGAPSRDWPGVGINRP